MMKERANPKSAAPRKVKGAVLFTVVCVMMVLIVFLMGTLALAATANKRALTNYQQEQTEYTARAVLTAVLRNINNDTTGALKSDMTAITAGNSIDVDVTIPGDVAQEVSTVTIANTGQTQTVYNMADGQWQTVPIYRLSVTVESETTSASTTYDAFITAANAVAGTTTTTTISGGGGGGGAFVSLGDLTTDIGTGGYITGGTYIGLDNKAKTPPVMNSYTVGGSAESMMDAPIYIYGNLTSSAHRYTVHFKQPGDFFAVEGDFSVTHDTGLGTVYDGFTWDSSLTNQQYEKTPFIYVGGTFNMNGTPVRIGSNDVPTNVFSGSFIFTGTNESNLENIHGDIYAFDPDKTSELTALNNSHTELYAWASSTLTVKDEGSETRNYGDILSAGSVKLNSQGNGDLEIGGSVRVDKNVQVTGGRTVKVGSTVSGTPVRGDVVVGGTLTVDANTTLECTGNIICGNLNNKGKIICGGTISAVNTAATGDLNGKSVTTITAPALATTTVSKTVYYTNFDGTPLTDVYVLQPGERGLPADHYLVQAHYKEHIINPDGSETVVDHGDQWNNAIYSGREEVVPEFAFVPDATYATVEDYLMATSEDYKNLKTYTSAANAFTSSTAETFYNLATAYGKDVYPDKYAKYKSDGSANMPDILFTEKDPTTGADVVRIPQASDYTSQYITTVAGLGSTIFQDGGAATDTNGNVISADYHGYSSSVTAYGTGAKYPAITTASLDDLAKNDNGDYYEVTSSCVISGNVDHNLHINSAAAAGSIIVVLDNVNMSYNNRASIIVEDSSQVILFVVGTLNCGAIITEDYLDLCYGVDPPATPGGPSIQKWHKGQNVSQAFTAMTGDLTIYQTAPLGAADPTYPNVLIYAEDSGDNSNPTKMVLRDTKELVTAIIRAPYMLFSQTQTGSPNKTIEYHPSNGPGVIKYGASGTYGWEDSDHAKHVGVIGELVAKQIEMNSSDKWGLIYVNDGSASGGSGGGGGGGTSITTTTGAVTEYFDVMYFNAS